MEELAKPWDWSRLWVHALTWINLIGPAVYLNVLLFGHGTILLWGWAAGTPLAALAALFLNHTVRWRPAIWINSLVLAAWAGSMVFYGLTGTRWACY